MKKLFYVAIIALMTLTYACGPKETIFELTSDSVISAPCEGGQYTITYNLVTEEANTVKAVADDKSMITSIDTQTEGCINIQVAENNTAQNREATILVSFGSKCFDVVVEQAAKVNEPEDPEDPGDDNPDDDYIIEVEANQLLGTYYGANSMGESSLYWIILSKDGIVNGATTPNSEYFRLDIAAPAAADENNIRIPDGHYKLDINNTYESFSILKTSNTDYTYIDNYGEPWITQFTYAELDVYGNSMFLMAVVEDKEYHVSFNGDYTIEYKKLSETISSLTSDHEIDLSNCTGTVKCYGDYWGCGYCNWGIEFVCNDGLKEGTFLVLDFLTDANTNGASGFEGTYQSAGFMENDPSQPNWGAYKFIPGFRLSDISNEMLGSVLVEHIDGIAVEQAPLYGGEFTITKNSNGTHTIVINATDDAVPAHKITLNWTGVLQ